MNGTPSPLERQRAAMTMVESAERIVGAVGDALADESARALEELLSAVEAATPRGVSVHARLDTIRKWLRVLSHPADHERFGGTVRVRDHVLEQLRGTSAALRDYFGATS